MLWWWDTGDESQDAHTEPAPDIPRSKIYSIGASISRIGFVLGGLSYHGIITNGL